MNATELRIGNWVNWGQDFQLDLGSLTQHYYNDVLQPIPLTGEWVKRFGLKQSNLVGGIYTDGDLNIKVDLPKYVHQLQNLYFALTGQELTIK